MLLKLSGLISYLLFIFISGDVAAADRRAESVPLHLQHSALLDLSPFPSEAPRNAGMGTTASTLQALHINQRPLLQKETKNSTVTASSSSSTLSFDSLPEDTIRTIASYLPWRENIVNLSNVNHAFYHMRREIIGSSIEKQPLKVNYAEAKGELILKPQIPQDVAELAILLDCGKAIGKSYFGPDPSQINNSFQPFTHLQKLIMRNNPLRGAQVATLLKSVSPELTYLDIDITNCRPEDARDLAVSLERFKFLQTLIMMSNPLEGGLAIVLTGVSPELIYLDISHTNCGSEDAADLAASLKLFPLLQTLIMWNNPWGGVQVATLLKSAPLTLTSLDISETNCEPKDVGILAPSLARFKFLQTLNLGGNLLGGFQIDALLKSVSPALTYLDIGNTNCGSEDAADLTVSLKLFPLLQTLIMGNNPLEGVQVATLLKSAPLTLTSLDISETNCEPKDVGVLAPSLARFKFLQILNLRGNLLGGVQVATLLKSVPLTLTSLDISETNCEPKDVGVLAPSLARFKFLQILNLRGNLLRAGLATILTGVSPALTSLDISETNCGSEDAEIIAPSLRHLIHLQTLIMGNNPLGSRGMAAFLSGVSATLTYLNISETNCGSEAEIIAPSFRHLIHLQILNMNGNPLGEVQIATLLNSVSRALAYLYISSTNRSSEDAGVLAAALARFPLLRGAITQWLQ